VLPFDSEYELLVRIQDLERRHIVATIDGAEAVSLILPPGETVIERFNDSYRKFKFVRASNAAVADPSSPDNGKLCISLWKETPWVYTVVPQQPADVWKIHADTVYRGAEYGHGLLRGSLGDNVHCLYSFNAGASVPPVPADEMGATVEGGASSVRYAQTAWRGDDACSLVSFAFSLAGKTQEPQTGVCSECGSKLAQNAKFCHKCGKRV
jgi:hypothetical protein